MSPATPEQGSPATPERGQSHVLTPHTSHRHVDFKELGSPLTRARSTSPPASPSRRPVSAPGAPPLTAPGADAPTPAPSSPQAAPDAELSPRKHTQTPDSSPPKRLAADRRGSEGLGPQAPAAPGSDAPGAVRAPSPPQKLGAALPESLGAEPGPVFGSAAARGPPGQSGRRPLLGPSLAAAAAAVAAGSSTPGPSAGSAASGPPAGWATPGFARRPAPHSAGGAAANPVRMARTPGGRAYFPSPRSRPWSSAKAPGGAPPGRLTMAASAVPPMPLRTFFLTRDEAAALPDAEVRPALLKAVEAVETYELAAQQFRGLANQMHVQSRLAAIARDENAQRHEVEATITQREVDRLNSEIVGISDATQDAEGLRHRLRRTRQKLKDMEALVDDRGREIAVLRQQLRDMRVQPLSPLDPPAPVQLGVPAHGTHSAAPPAGPAGPVGPTGPAGPVAPVAPAGLVGPAGYQGPPSSAGSAIGPGPSPGPATALSGLELLASQVLSEQLQRSPERRRRPSSSSTISAQSDTDNDE